MNGDKLDSFDIILLCGLYGSGKTGYAASRFSGKSRSRISRSEIRKLIYEMTNFGDSWTADKFNEEDDVLVKHVERKIIEHYLHTKRKILIINTFMTQKSRSRFISIAKQMKKTIAAVFLDTPLQVCLQRNEQEKNSLVSNRVIEILNKKKEPPDKKEGFDEVVIVKN